MRALLLTILLLAVSACATVEESTLSSCDARLPEPWQRAIDQSAVPTGGSITTQAVGPRGEVVAVRDNYATRDVLLVQPDKSMAVLYTVPNPDAGDDSYTTVEAVAVDDRRVVVGVHRERGDNGSRPYVQRGEIKAGNGDFGRTLARIDVIDRADDSVRTIVTGADLSPRGEVLTGLEIDGDTVFWQTSYLDTFQVEDVARSFNLNTGDTTEVASGVDIEHRWRALTPTTTVPDAERVTLDGDGTNYAWITGLGEGGTGIARWSPRDGLTTVTTDTPLSAGRPYPPRIHVEGPFVVIEGAATDRDAAVVLDTRSGAIAPLGVDVVDTGGSTVATTSSAPGVAPFVPSIAGLIRLDDLPELTCGG